MMGNNGSYMVAWHAANPQKSAEYSKRYRATNPDAKAKARERQRRYRAKLPVEVMQERNSQSAETHRLYRVDWQLRKKYGISLAERDAMLEKQGGCCAGCSGTTPAWRGDWHVDHCHKTGVIRGILCHNCNTTLGRANDDPAVLRRLADYLCR